MLSTLGILRLSLLALALLNTLPPLLIQFGALTVNANEESFASIFLTLVVPVMAPILLVVILFDYVMSRVQAADAEGDAATRYASIARIELVVMLFTLLAWIPFFLALVR
ncbi:MAG: hypothetical protein QNJ85_00825 [Gammaproteobacteria bacterium]|nr:hypothetical protein [Gammaproteobacteria bacterium]